MTPARWERPEMASSGGLLFQQWSRAAPFSPGTGSVLRPVTVAGLRPLRCGAWQSCPCLLVIVKWHLHSRWEVALKRSRFLGREERIFWKRGQHVRRHWGLRVYYWRGCAVCRTCRTHASFLQCHRGLSAVGCHQVGKPEHWWPARCMAQEANVEEFSYFSFLR